MEEGWEVRPTGPGRLRGWESDFWGPEGLRVPETEGTRCLGETEGDRARTMRHGVGAAGILVS